MKNEKPMKKEEKNNEKIPAIVLLLTLTITLFSGCGTTTSTKDNQAQTESSNSKAETKNANLQVLWFSDGQEGKVFMELAKEYEGLNPGITIELIETPYDEMNNKVKNMLAAGAPPALARLSSVGEYKNQLIDLKEYVSSGEDFADNFYEMIKIDYDGKMLAAPMDVTANGLIYNKTAFDKAGVSVPQSEDEIWTWDEWKKAMLKVMAEGDVKYGCVFDKSPFRFSTLIYEAGGRLLNEDMTASAFNSQENIDAVQFFYDLHKEGIIPDSVWLGSENPNNLFRTGQVATHFGGSWLINNYQSEISDFEWGVTYLPSGKQRSSVPGGKYIAAFQNSGVEQEAANFIEWISQREQNAKYCQQLYFLTGTCSIGIPSGQRMGLSRVHGT